ncbi:MAG TPA: hypothetical protein VE863_07570 [Pyrinomonadaceae bacterium]|jgi:glutamine amidotransferase-like uncharacterized protein|nr:hypothetical protein [Pyrinomonadaceae bacterium]
MSKKQALEFKARWEAVNRFIVDEARTTPPQVRMKQLMTLFNPGAVFPQAESSKDVEIVRARWVLLKAKLHA